MTLAGEAGGAPGNPRPRLLVTRRWPGPVQDALRRQFDVELNDSDDPLSGDQLRAAMTLFDALCPTITDRIDAALLQAPDSRVRIVANYGAGTEHIDLVAARAAGILVTNTPDALTATTAELAILLMLMAARRAGEGERALRAGRWPGWSPTYLLGAGLSGKTLGLFGFGRIAQATAERARALGMKIIYFSRSRAPIEVEMRLEARRTESLEELLGEADVVSLHAPGGAATHHVIDAARLRQMRPSAILVNTARGSLIDEAALLTALQDRTIGSAGLDVFANEPDIDPAFAGLDNAVLLPHLGSATQETRVAMGMQAVANLDAYFAGRDVPNRVA